MTPHLIPPEFDTVVSVDLGKRLCGVAEWTRGGDLLRAATVEGGPKPSGMASAVNLWAMFPKGPKGTSVFPCYVIELPVNYGNFRVAHKDLDVLRAVGSILRPLMGFSPHAWKGNVPKKIHHARIHEALTHQELGTLPSFWRSLDHNARDAIGIGLYFFGRTGRGGTL